MVEFKILVIQTFKTKKSAIVTIKAETLDGAMELIDSIDLPGSTDPRWDIDSNDLMNEEYIPQ
jgi:hypothetical protein